jgi:hypothetical protein
MGRSACGRRATCESCLSIDVRQWHRHGLLRHAGLRFTWSWTRHGKPLGSIDVRTAADAVVLTIKGGSEWGSVEQRVPLTWTRVPPRRRTRLVPLQCVCRRPALRATCGEALPARCRGIRMPTLLRIGLPKPAGDPTPSGDQPSAKA